MPTVYVSEPLVWEYKHVVRALQDAPSVDELNDLGRTGWELAGVFTDAGDVHLYFKRIAD